jgi:hypothetical protein
VPFETGGDARQLFAFLGILGGGDGEREFEQFELARGGRVEAEAVEAGGLLGILHLGVDGALVDFGGEGFGVVGDVGGLDPVGAAGIDIQGEQVPLGLIGEFARVIGRRLWAASGKSGEERSEAQNCLNLHAYTVPDLRQPGRFTLRQGRTACYDLKVSQ